MVQTEQVQISNFYLKTRLFFPTLWSLAIDLGKTVGLYFKIGKISVSNLSVLIRKVLYFGM